MTPERRARMPAWPARMGEDMAADYLGVSLTTLRERVASRQYPQPVREGTRKFFSQRQLDKFIDAQFGVAADNDQEGAGWGR